MANQLTVTAKSGPAVQSTAIVLSDVNAILYDFERQVVQTRRGTYGEFRKSYDLTGVTTLTISLSSGVYTLVLS